MLDDRQITSNQSSSINKINSEDSHKILFNSSDSNDSFYLYEQFLLNADEISSRYKSCLSSSSSESSDDEFCETEDLSNVLTSEEMSAYETLKIFQNMNGKAQDKTMSHEIEENIKVIKEEPIEKFAVIVEDKVNKECSLKIEKLKLQGGSKLKYKDNFFVCLKW